MGVIISVYSQNAFREFILPAADNTDHTITLGRRYFGIGNDLRIGMEVLSGVWYIKGSDEYTVRGAKLEQGRYRLETGHMIALTDRDDNDFRLISREVPELYHSYRKFWISGLSRIMIGRAQDNDICYDSLGLVSKYHAVMTKENGSWMINNRSKNGIYVDSQRVMEECELKYGSFINIFGLHLIALGDVLAVDESQEGVVLGDSIRRCSLTDKNHDGQALRAPGYRSGSRNEEITEKIGVPPEMMGMEEVGTSAETTDNAKASTVDRTTVTIEQPVLGVNKWKDIYKEYLDKIEQELRALSEKNRSAMLAMYPDPADIMSDEEAESRLWDRSISDEALLRIRIGTGEIPSLNDIVLEEGKLFLTDRDLYDRAVKLKEEYKTLSDMPFTIDLGGISSVCLSGKSRAACLAMSEKIAVQLAQHISPADLKLAFIADESREGDILFSFKEARWLPHTWSEDMSCRYYASDRAGAAETIYRLSRVLISREEMSDEEIAELPRYVVFISDTSVIAGSVLQKYMIKGRWLGFTVIYASVKEKEKEAVSQVLIEESDDKGHIYGVVKTGRDEYIPDRFDTDRFGGFARRLASVRNEASDGIAIIPDFVTLFDTLGIKSAEELGIRDKWAKNRTYDHLKGALGKGAGNMVRTLDLHERYQGPHALIAGTTGSGKSELLQSYIVSLAAEYSPKDLEFVLVDFKGGGMANTLKGLPHIAGLITNLSGGEISRAMLAVKNEIVKRQKILNDYGINHIDDYVRLYKSGEVSEPVPHLMIVVDEFAELKKEKPEFMKDLISVAQTGRSLGIHLVLATQRPRGNVDDDIRSNMRSAVCLRVQDRKDSMDVLDRPDAAYLTGAGRGYLEVGAGEIFEPFQAAFSGKSRMSSRKDTGRVLMLTDDGRADVVSAFEEHEETASEPQLVILRNEIIKTAGITGENAADLWLPELKHMITTEDVAKADRRSESRGNGVAVGMIDDPENRLQYPLMLEFPGSGNIAIVGTPSSGKTTALKTLLSQIADRMADPGSDQGQDISIYGIDLDSGMMEAFEGQPFVKQIVSGQDVLGIEELLDDLSEMTERRKAAGNAAGAESDGSAVRYAGAESIGGAAVVLIDSYEDFRNIAGYKCETKLSELMREGPGVGISYVMTGGGFGLGQISGSAERNTKTVLSLQQRNRYEYMDTLHTSGIETIPEEDVKGRGLTVIRGRVLEFQIAYAK